MSPYRHPVIILVFFLVIKLNGFTQDTLRFWRSPSEKLNQPFGTILTLQVEIFDGDKLKDVFHQGTYLFKIKSVDSLLLTTPILMEFKDETDDYFPTQDFELYKYFYGIDTGVLSDQDVKKIKRKYVGQEFTVVGYESGEFFGSPVGLGKYQIITSTPFHFRHYFIVISDLSENGWRGKKGSLKK